MAELTIKSKILFRHDTAANWSTKNPILKTGEPGWDSSNKRLKIGNNTLAWSNLEWAFPDPQRYKDTELILGSDMYSGIGRIATNGNNLELAAFGFDFQLDTAALHIGEYGDFYSESNSSLGTETYPWNKVYTNRVFGNSPLWFGIGGSDYLALEELANSESIFSLKPYQNQAGDLGTISNPWKNLYTSEIYGNNLIMNPAAVGEVFNIDDSRNFLCLDEPLTLKKWKSFIITGFDYNAKTFTLNSVSGLAVGDTYSTSCTGSVYNDYGQITAISGNTVTVSAIPNASFGSYLNANPSYNHMSWYIRSKAEAGTTYVSYFDKIGTSNFIMVTNAKLYTSYVPDTILNSNNNFCFGDGLIIPTSKTYNLVPCFKIGKYDNDYTGSYPFLIGWGTSDTTRKNIFYVNTLGDCYANSYNLIGGGSVLKYKHYSSVNMYISTNREKGMFSVYNPTNNPTGSASTYYGGFNVPLGADSTTTYVGQLYFERGAPRMHYHYSTGSSESNWSSWYKIPVGICGQITRGTSAPSGGRDGDIYLQY